MLCNICKTEIQEPIHVEVNALIVRHDESYVGNIVFSQKEKNDINDKLICHKTCWERLISVKKNVLKKVEVI